MFKKTLTSLAVLATLSTPAMAADIITSPVTLSAEGVVTAASVAAPAISVDLNATYTKDDIINITFTSDIVAAAQTVVAIEERPAVSIPTTSTLNSTANAIVVDVVFNGISYETGAAQTINGDIVAAGSPVTFGAGADAVTTSSLDLSQSAPSSQAITVGFLSKSGGTATYRITDITNSTVTSGYFLQFSGFTLKTADVVSEKSIDVSYSAETARAVPIDVATTNTENAVVKTASQFKVALTSAVASGTTYATGGFDSVVDVSANRLSFVDGVDAGTASDVSDVLTFKLTDSASSVTSDATLTGATYEVKGDFSWILDTSATTANIQAPTGVLAVSNGTLGAVKSDSIVITQTAAQAASNTDVTLTVDTSKNFPATATGTARKNAAVLPAGSYTIDADVSYTTVAPAQNAVETTDGIKAGAWSLNGASKVIEAYPLSTAVTGLVWVANTSTQTGDVVASVVTAGETFDLGVIGQSTPKSLVPFGQALEEAMDAADVPRTGRGEVTITVNAPSANVNVSASYKVDSADDRLTLNVR